MDVKEDAGLRPQDYKLKLNSYDLSVDIELADALQRIRFEHPEVHVVVLTSLKPRIFCAGANIFMLGSSSHGFKVNFCKFTNETRLGMEDLSASQRRQVPRSPQRHLCRRRLRAGPGLRRDLPGRRRRGVGGAAGNAAARRAAGHRRPHPRGGQAQGAARPGRCVQHPHRGRAREAGGRMAPGGPRRADQPVQGGGGRPCARSWPRCRIGRRRAPASRCGRWRRRSTATRSHTRSCAASSIASGGCAI